MLTCTAPTLLAQQLNDYHPAITPIKNGYHDVYMAVDVLGPLVVEVGYSKAAHGEKNGKSFFSAYQIGVMVYAIGKDFRIAPNIGFTYSPKFLNVGLSICGVTNFKEIEPVLRPQIGLSLFGKIDLYVIMNIELTDANIAELPDNVIGIKYALFDRW